MFSLQPWHLGFYRPELKTLGFSGWHQCENLAHLIQLKQVEVHSLVTIQMTEVKIGGSKKKMSREWNSKFTNLRWILTLWKAIYSSRNCTHLCISKTRFQTWYLWTTWLWNSNLIFLSFNLFLYKLGAQLKYRIITICIKYLNVTVLFLNSDFLYIHSVLTFYWTYRIIIWNYDHQKLTLN